MALKTYTDYVTTNDFEGAFDRFTQATKRYKQYWFDCCVEIFSACADWAKHYVIDPVSKTIQKLTAKVEWECDVISGKGKELCYIISVYDANNEFLFDKVGTTKMKVQTRMKGILKEYNKKMGASKIIVHRVFDCGEMSAEGLESYIRAYYIKKDSKSFLSKDRFTKPFEVDTIDRLANEFLN